MRRVVYVFALLVAALPASAAQYGWSISASDVDAHVHTGGVAPGPPGFLYLWYECNLESGLLAADFTLATVGITLLAFQPMNGFLNAGNDTHLLLFVGGCPNAPVVAGRFIVLYPGGPASLCIDSSGGTAVDCDSAPWPMRAVGWDALSPPSCDERVEGLLCGPGCHQDFCHPDLGCITGFCTPCGSCDPCDPSCPPVGVEPTRWGSVKALYR